MQTFLALEIIRGATRQAHQDLEDTLSVTRPDAGRDEYLVYIEALWGWLSSFEDELWTPHWPDGIDVEVRGAKCAWLAQDLKDAGIDWRTVPVCDFTPDLSTLPQRIGLAYVIEGAQLGTRILSKSLLPRLEGWSPRWLQGYGCSMPTKWREFLTFAEIHLPSQEDGELAARAAQDGFKALSAWFRQCAEVKKLESFAS